MAKEYVQCTLQIDTRQQMRYKKVGKEIHGKKKKWQEQNKKQARGRGRVSKHGCSTRIWFGKKVGGKEVVGRGMSRSKDYEKFWYSRNGRNGH